MVLFHQCLGSLKQFHCRPQDKGRNMDRYHLPGVTQNLLPFCNSMLRQSTNGSDEWQWQRLNCAGLQDFALKSLAAAPHVPAWKLRIFTKELYKTFSLDFWIPCNQICKYCIFLLHTPRQIWNMCPWGHNNLTTKTLFKASRFLFYNWSIRENNSESKKVTNRQFFS